MLIMILEVEMLTRVMKRNCLMCFCFCKEVEVWVTGHTPIILCYHLGTCYDSVKKLYAFQSFLLFCRWPVNIVTLPMLLNHPLQS